MNLIYVSVCQLLQIENITQYSQVTQGGKGHWTENYTGIKDILLLVGLGSFFKILIQIFQTSGGIQIIDK